LLPTLSFAGKGNYPPSIIVSSRWKDLPAWFIAEGMKTSGAQGLIFQVTSTVHANAKL
jgi:hypothetical protein